VREGAHITGDYRRTEIRRTENRRTVRFTSAWRSDAQMIKFEYAGARGTGARNDNWRILRITGAQRSSARSAHDFRASGELAHRQVYRRMENWRTDEFECWRPEDGRTVCVEERTQKGCIFVLCVFVTIDVFFWSKGCFCFAVSVSTSVYLVESLFLLYVSVSIHVFVVERLILNCCVCEHKCIFGRKAVFALLCL